MQRVSAKADSSWILVVLMIAAAVTGVVAVLRLDTTGETGSGLSNAYTYDLTELAKVDPNLILYAEVGSRLDTGFRRARALVLDANDRMYVAGDRAIRVFSRDGDPQRVIEVAGEPQCLALDGAGKIYAGLQDHVEILNAEGQRLASWEPLGDETVLTSIAVHGDNVFVADAGHRVVLHYDTTGTFIKPIGEKDPERNIPGFVIPSPHFDLAVSRDGLLRVVNPGRHRIEAYTLGGDLEFWWGERSTGIQGFCGCCNPVSFALLPNGWFVTTEKGLVRVKIYDSDGAFVGVVASPMQLTGGNQLKICDTPEECQEGGLDVAVGTEGRIYVLDTTENVIRVFRRKDVSP